MQCSGCGSTNVSFDPQRRILVCNQCGKEEYYSRSTLNANSKVVYCRQNAINFFVNGKYDIASQFAHDVINISMDNAPALYILAFHDNRQFGQENSMRSFFKFAKQTMLEYDEINELMQLFLAVPYSLIENESDVITILAANLQDLKDATVLCDFLDKLCPYLIGKRPSMSFLTKDMVEMYCELAEHCGIPKTCYALLNSIQTNPDSPYVSNTFFLKAKTRFFYENFVIPIGKIIDSMAPNQYKEKFQKAFIQRKNKYVTDAGL